MFHIVCKSASPHLGRKNIHLFFSFFSQTSGEHIVVNEFIRCNPGISGRLERKRKRERSNLAETVMAHNACQLAEICPSDAVKTNK